MIAAGNVASIVTANANPDDAARKIAVSKTFDNATSCSSENSVVIEDVIYARMLDALTMEPFFPSMAFSCARRQCITPVFQ